MAVSSAEHPDPVIKKTASLPMARRGLASNGTKLQLLSNHIKVNVAANSDYHFFQYTVAIADRHGRPVNDKGIVSKVLDWVARSSKDLGRKDFAYDGGKSLFTVGPLPSNKLKFIVVLEDFSFNRSIGNGSPHSYPSKVYMVEVSYAAKIPMKTIAQALHGQDSDISQEALRVLDIVLRQHAAKMGCLLVRKSFFHKDLNNFSDVGGGVLAYRGFHSNFRMTQDGLSLNIDIPDTMIIQPGPVVDFLLNNQNAKDPLSLDWEKAQRVLKNLRVKTSPTNTEYQITGLSTRICKELMFWLKQRDEKDLKGKPRMIEISVYDYFVNIRNIPLLFSGDLPCINVGKPKRPTYIPLELCSLVPLQSYTRALTTLQRASLVEKSCQKAQDRMETLTNARFGNYANEPFLRACGISLGHNFTQVEGRILAAPRLIVGNGEDISFSNGHWNFRNKKLVEPATVRDWAVVNFSAHCHVDSLISGLIRCGKSIGIIIPHPTDVFEESSEDMLSPPLVRVVRMLDSVGSKMPHFLLCILPERKSSRLYVRWKNKTLVEYGVATQCIAPTRVDDQYLTNVLLKINAKLGGLNWKPSIMNSTSISLVSEVPTLILGIAVTHGPLGQFYVPSIVAVASSRCWPLISKYRASFRTQSPKVEMIDSLFKNVAANKDAGIMREILLDFYISSGQRKPDQIIIFRDGVCESQFNQVLNVELNQIIMACKFLDEKWCPKFVIIITQKKHHTKFFLPTSTDNVPPGTVIDNGICHPRNNDFYLCTQTGMIGTTRPTHYHVLLDEVGFSPDDLQEFVHSLSYGCQGSMTAISVVAPVHYAHLAATQMRQFMNIDDMPETSSSLGGGVTAAGPVAVPQLPCLHKDVCNSMFFV